MKTQKKTATRQGQKFFIESKTRQTREATLEDYDEFVSSHIETFKKDEINRFNELNTLYSQYMLNSSEENLKILLEDEINKAKKRFTDYAIKLKKEEENSILRMNMTFDRKMQDFYVLNKEQKGLFCDSQRYINIINELSNYRKFPIKQKVALNRIYNLPLLIYEIKEFGNESEARIEAFKEVSTFKTFHYNSCGMQSDTKEGLFMLEMRENLANCVRLNNL